VSSRTLPCGALPDGRAHIGACLERIVAYEAKHGRPPITALVVRKAAGRPGPGFAEAAARIRFAQPGETGADTWAGGPEVLDYRMP
jgi:hypothetical protein